MPEIQLSISEETAALAAGWKALRGASIPAAFNMLSDLAGSMDTTPEQVARAILSLPPENTRSLRDFLRLCAAGAQSAHDISGELAAVVSNQQWKNATGVKTETPLDIALPRPAREARPLAMSSIRIVAKLTDLEAVAIRRKVPLAEACRILAAQGKDREQLWSDHERQAETRDAVAGVFDEGRFCRIDALTSEFARGAELLVALGGDGNFAAVSHFVNGRTAVTGVNIDPETSRGAILQYANASMFLDSLDDLVRGNFRYDPWPRLSAKINGQPIQQATCEIYLGSASPYRMSWIRHCGESAAGNRSPDYITSSSGLLISLGSGLFLQNAGRSIFPGKILFPVNAPYARYLFREINRSEAENSTDGAAQEQLRDSASGVILPGETLSVTSLTRGPALLAVDSQLEYGLNNGTTVEISLASEPLWTVKPL